MTKPFNISKNIVWEAYQKVKTNGGSSGVDNESIESFEQNLKDNLYKLWNRLSSGSYYPRRSRVFSYPRNREEKGCWECQP